jgi:catechol 2,3-dioxygenase
VRLRTGGAKKALSFYTGALGLSVVPRPGSAQETGLSATEDNPEMIVLREEPGAKPRAPRTTGLYHLAIRYATRRDLAHALNRLLREGHPIEGASDHRVSEAIYLSDLDGNGVELYADRPRSEWSWRDGEVAMTSQPLDLESLMASTEGETPPPEISPQTDIGHIHLHVADLAVAERFYHDYLGLTVTQRSYPGALFLSAGGYHHHVAVNTWAGKTPPPEDSVGLISYRLTVPESEILYGLQNRAPLAGYEMRTATAEDGSELVQIRDPNGNWLEVSA